MNSGCWGSDKSHKDLFATQISGIDVSSGVSKDCEACSVDSSESGCTICVLIMNQQAHVRLAGRVWANKYSAQAHVAQSYRLHMSTIHLRVVHYSPKQHITRAHIVHGGHTHATRILFVPIPRGLIQRQRPANKDNK